MFFDPAVATPVKDTAITLQNLSGKDLSALVLALGALGTAAYGVVDASKALFGGPSNAGFGYIKRVMKSFFPKDSENDETTGLSLGSILRTLKSNWINGMLAADQKSIAKSLIKLRLNGANAPHFAELTGVDVAVFTTAAKKVAEGAALGKKANGTIDENSRELDVYGRFDLVLTTLIDQAYQRADQLYRNAAKSFAIVASVALALLGGWTMGMKGLQYGELALLGLIATPLAPIAKDLSSAIAAAAKVAQAWRK